MQAGNVDGMIQLYLLMSVFHGLGQVREINETPLGYSKTQNDSEFVSEVVNRKGRLYAVADGMGATRRVSRQPQASKSCSGNTHEEMDFDIVRRLEHSLLGRRTLNLRARGGELRAVGMAPARQPCAGRRTIVANVAIAVRI